jgi:hypothetical protein
MMHYRNVWGNDTDRDFDDSDDNNGSVLTMENYVGSSTCRTTIISFRQVVNMFTSGYKRVIVGSICFCDVTILPLVTLFPQYRSFGATWAMTFSCA